MRKRFIHKLRSDRYEFAPNRRTPAKLPFQVVTFAGKGSFPEVVAMLDSFYSNAGDPRSCRVISDGTLTEADGCVLAKIHAKISILSLDQFLTRPLPPCLANKLEEHPLMKKLGALIETARLENGFYIDSDVLFFSEAREFDWSSLVSEPGPRYMQDVAFTLDPRLLNEAEKSAPNNANSGLVLFNHPADLAPYAARLRDLGEQWPNHFSEQTIVHLALSDLDATPLDPKIFVLAFDDQFWFRDKYAYCGKAVCRHYTTPIRHKFWIQTFFH